MGDEQVSGVVNGELPETPVNQGGEAQENARGQAGAEYIRASDAAKMIEDAVERALRQSQSMTDKASHKLSQQFSELKSTIDDLKASGTQVPAEMLEAMREMSSELDSSVAGEAAGADAEADDDVDGRAAEIFKESGVTVFKNDPEAGMVDHSTPKRFLETLAQAAKAKAEREGRDTSHLPMVGRGGATNPIGDVRDPSALYDMALGVRRR